MPKLTFNGDPMVENPWHQGGLSFSNEEWNKSPGWFMPSASELDMGRPVTEKVTGNVDGSAPAVDFLGGITQAILGGMGADDGEPQVYRTSAGGGQASGLLSTNTILMVAAVGAGVYFLAGR